tara:strand:- start:1879 stop:2997 length:1119 start_codon:yes stop_codon:yes gene_type:complete
MDGSNYNIENNSVELMKFINKECHTKKINFKKIFRFFSKCLRKSIIEMNNKFSDINSNNEGIISGVNMIYHIYYILIVYSNNIKLTIFLLERAILLYTEFIIMSQDKSVVEEIYFVPNINDAVSFSFKKTIGPIIITNIETLSKNMRFIKNVCLTLRNIYKMFFKNSYYCDESNLISINVENNIDNIETSFKEQLDLVKLKYNYYNEDVNYERQIATYVSNSHLNQINDLSLEEFLNIINNEITESLLILNNSIKYYDILKKIDCIINGNDTLNIKLGKIKILLYMFNREYQFTDSTIKFNESNNILNFLKDCEYSESNIIYSEILERFFDTLVYYTFKTPFIHNTSKDSVNLKINENYIECHLNEIFDYMD